MTDDAELINAIRHDSELGFRILMKEKWETVYWHIRRLVIHHSDAQDATQETFIRIFRSIDKFKGDSSLNVWIYRIATNETLNFLQRKKDMTGLDDAPTAIVNQLTADEYFDGNETELQLQKAIASLPNKQRAVFHLKYYEEMKYEEMSSILNTSVGALKASYHHAVKKICDFFKSQD